jgi:predicted ATPase
MRIIWLKIPNYRNLKNFEISFNYDEPTSVVLGHNGMGKSNLIEAIVEIFMGLEAGKPTEFEYAIRYDCRDTKVEITADPNKKNKKLEIKINENSISLSEFEKNKDIYLPSYVFSYYSGWNDRLERQFDKSVKKYYYEVLRNPDNELPLRRFFFCQKHYSQLVLLTFFLDNSLIAKEIFNYLEIKSFESSLFVLRQPWWGKKRNIREQERLDTDPRFWNAGGAFKSFLGRLWNSALAPIKSTETIEREIPRRSEQIERLYLFFKNLNSLKSLQNDFESSKSFFAYLESLYLCDLIDQVKVKVIKKDGSKVSFNQLSEGEQQLLTVIGLLLFTQSDDALYLLDEPDTHLNPVWTYKYVDLIRSTIKSSSGHLIIATHDPLMISALYKQQVRVLSSGEDITNATEPEYDPVSMGIEGLLKSELYGLASTLAPDILTKLNRHYFLLGKKDKTEDEEMEAMKLAQELNNLGISRTHPNPYFESFAKAMAKRMPKPDENLSKDEIDAQAKLADMVLDEILSEEKNAKGGN